MLKCRTLLNVQIMQNNITMMMIISGLFGHCLLVPIKIFIFSRLELKSLTSVSIHCHREWWNEILVVRRRSTYQSDKGRIHNKLRGGKTGPNGRGTLK
jgi:hypothetical protein